jgi:hypothetical protein
LLIEACRRKTIETLSGGISPMESQGIGKDIAILAVGAAIGIISWLLEKAGMTVPKAIVLIAVEQRPYL